MTAKRSATTELNHNNWNEKYEPEEAGMFTKASEDVLEKRVVKTAKRRLPSRDGPSKSAFDAFKGFKTTAAAQSSPFSFLANANTNDAPSKTNTNITTSVASNGASKSAQNGANKTENSAETQTSSANKTNISDQEDDKLSKKPSDYYAKLKGLNESVTQWIKTHVDANPFCILTPIFQDYERYLKEIESKHGSEPEKSTHASEQIQSTHNNDNSKEPISTEKRPDNSPFGGTGTKTPLVTTEWKPEKSIFGNISTSTKSIFGTTEQAADNTKSVFSNTDQTTDSHKSIFGNIEPKGGNKSIFGNVNFEKNPFLNKVSSITDNKPAEEESKSDVKSTSSLFPPSNVTAATFSFGQGSTTSNVSAGFSFGSAKPFSFGARVVKPQDTDEKSENEKEDEEEEPPKADFKPITEEGATYEQRCKVFVKKDGNFSDRGIGTLFLKPTPNGKTQLIVRAETSLGNLLLNTLLTETIPTKRMNKNTIMMVCLPKPESSPPPVPVLLRVKTDEDADALFDALNKHKK